MDDPLNMVIQWSSDTEGLRLKVSVCRQKTLREVPYEPEGKLFGAESVEIWLFEALHTNLANKS